MPNPTFRINIVSRKEGESAVSAAAYQTGEHIYSRRDREVKYEGPKEELVLKEIFLPAHAPPEFADRETLWNSVEAAERNWNSQLCRRMKIALPRELSQEDNIALAREYIQKEFVSKGMIADLAVHYEMEPVFNPHFHVLLTMRPLDENGKWMPKGHKVPVLDKDGNPVILESGRLKTRKVPTMDWNDRGNAEKWRHDWEVMQNAYLERAGRPERISMKSYERQGIDKIPTVHMGPAVTALERKGIRTDIGDLNREIVKHNALMSALKSMIREAAQLLESVREIIRQFRTEPKEVYLLDMLIRKFDERSNEREQNWKSRAGIDRADLMDLKRFSRIVGYMQQEGILTVRDLESYLERITGEYDIYNSRARSFRKESREIETTVRNMERYKELQPLHDKYSRIFFKKAKEKYYREHKSELDEWARLNRFARKKYPDPSQYNRQELEDRQAELNYRISELEERIVPFQEELNMLKDIQWLVRDLLPELDPENTGVTVDDIVRKEEQKKTPVLKQEEKQDDEKRSSAPEQAERKEPPERKKPAGKTKDGRTSVLGRLDEKKEKLQAEDERRQSRRSQASKKRKQDMGIG